jgi:3-oxoacyl-(acyl-carrier-protein) synthase III
MIVRVGITATGSFLPAAVLSSADLQREITQGSDLKLPDGVISRVTGINERRVAAPREYASTLAIGAGQHALAAAGLGPVDIDLLLFASATRDMAEPATAHIVQEGLGTTAHALDVTNACNSFVNGIDVARAMIIAGRARRALVVTGETPTRAVYRRPTSITQFRDGFAGYTFGDAGAAVVVEPVANGGITSIDSVTHSEYWNIGGIAGGGSRQPRGDEYTYFSADSNRLRKIFEQVGPQVIKNMLVSAGLEWPDFRYVLAHQVTLPYVHRLAEVTGAPMDKLVLTIPELGNIASATLGLQLDRIYSRLEPGDRVLLIGLGGGISIMTMVLEKS